MYQYYKIILTTFVKPLRLNLQKFIFLRRKNYVPKGVVRWQMHTADKSRKLKLIPVSFLYSHATTVKWCYMGMETKS